MSKNRSRAVIWILLVMLSLVIFCSSVFIITHADHDCSGENCSVCTELAECCKNLNTLGAALISGTHLSVMIFALSVKVRAFTKTRSDHTTLISLNVELLN